MAKHRILINNPSAHFLCPARLDDYKLAFTRYSSTWKGGCADLVPSPGSHAWGTVWRIGNQDAPALDKQEGVDVGAYQRFTVNVIDAEQKKYECRSYHVVTREQEHIAPHPSYLGTILKGARDQGLPADYVAFLETIKDNGVTELGETGAIVEAAKQAQASS
eukprot:CAMPEP_0114556814 /NCGR_PEP_ID=MMETSP0114-20121206/9487_1 /TAXON_ID=31324 /ORGANISM="Goniomonas sp, Strain m" /LENGTH=161 /DNA_ID=CAMNT_0001742039 /DNA_START=78 /DNA_END=563 /DNA_ORIENTATION=+